MDKINEFQQQNTIMFTRIMDRLGGSSSVEGKESHHNNSELFGLVDNWSTNARMSLEQLGKINDLCNSNKDFEKKWYVFV